MNKEVSSYPSSLSSNLKSKNSELEEARIKKIDILSFGTTLAVINAIFGFIFGLFFTLFSLSGFGTESLQQIIPETFKWIIGIGAVIFFPILFGILGFFQGVIVAMLYNLAARISKGIKLYS